MTDRGDRPSRCFPLRLPNDLYRCQQRQTTGCTYRPRARRPFIHESRSQLHFASGLRNVPHLPVVEYVHYLLLVIQLTNSPRVHVPIAQTQADAPSTRWTDTSPRHRLPPTQLGPIDGKLVQRVLGLFRYQYRTDATTSTMVNEVYLQGRG